MRHNLWLLPGLREWGADKPKVGNTWGKQSLITNKGILSYPGALFEGIAMNTLCTSSLVTALNSNSLSVVCDGQILRGLISCATGQVCRITSCLLSHRFKKVIEFIGKCIILCLWWSLCDLSCLAECFKWFSKLPRSCSLFREFPGQSIPVLPLVTPLSPYFTAP